MTVSNAQFLKQNHDVIRAQGDKVISSDGSLEIVGFEGLWTLTKQFPWPLVTVGGNIEVPTPLGAMMYQPQQAKVAHQGAISFQEVVAGSIDNMLVDLIRSGGRFNAKVYEGTPGVNLRYKPIYDCFMVIDNPERDFENRSQVLVMSGNIFFHYYGEVVAGNSDNYRP
ncbi:MAG: hypothetical protein PHU14_08060 [Methylovulum sp.]|nr:hypothetical protein [Methylovulum sp.]